MNLNQVTFNKYETKPLPHSEVYALNATNYLTSYIIPLSYSIPDEYVVPHVPTKHHVWAEIIPGESLTYRFGLNDENEYYQMYQSSRFAFTSMKGGWDCLRHYEILASGCIPVFKNIDKCNQLSLTTFPKSLLQEAYSALLPWKGNESLYNSYVSKLLNHCAENCTVSSSTKYILSELEKRGTKNIRNALLIRTCIGVNYTREMFWIGMKRYINSINGIATEYPAIDYLYDDFGTDSKLYGLGYTYTNKLPAKSKLSDLSEQEIISTINDRVWDIVVYGKIGPDEGPTGTLPNLPFWDIVKNIYHKNRIIFLYGGDRCFNFNNNNRYLQHLLHHSQYGICCVRELQC
jgi:hypothetical protein